MRMMWKTSLIALALASLALAPGTVSGQTGRATLVMIDLDHCPTCLAWKRDVQPGYVKSDIHARLPLEIINIKQLTNSRFFDLPTPSVFPTFYIVGDDGDVLATMEGYLSGDFFWGYLDANLRRLNL